MDLFLNGAKNNDRLAETIPFTGSPGANEYDDRRLEFTMVDSAAPVTSNFPPGRSVVRSTLWCVKCPARQARAGAQMPCCV